MTFMHKELAHGRWFTFSLMEQLGHVGSEVDRAIHWSKKDDITASRNAIDRALDLIDLTLADARWKGRRGEVCRMREVLCDRFYGDNAYHSTDESLQKYFLYFGLVAAAERANG